MNKKSLGSFVEFKNGLNYSKEDKAKGCKIIGVTDFKDNLFVSYDDLDEVNSSIVSDETLLQNNDLLFVRSNGNKELVGRCIYIKDLEEKISFSGFSIRARLINNNICLPLYLFYYCISPLFKKNLATKVGNGTNIRNLTQTVLSDLTIELPSISKQKKIVNVLDSITQKIELNKKINAELEAISKTLYEYWFVQFDFPDKKGNPYKSSGGKMVYNETLKREIPERFNVTNIKSCIEHINTGLNPRDNFILNDGDIKYVTVKNITKKGSIDFNNCDTINKNAQKIVHNRSNIDKGDILFASIAPLGRCYLIQEYPSTWDINESVFSIRPNKKISSEYLYMFLTSDIFVKKAENNSTGSVFAGIRIKTLEDMSLILPEDKILKSFTDKISILLKQKHMLNIENQKLEELRNWLLPMLLNGQVGFKESSQVITNSSALSSKKLISEAINQYKNNGCIDIEFIARTNDMVVYKNSSVKKAEISFNHEKGLWQIAVREPQDSFSIAHEIAHAVLHPEFVKQAAVARKDEHSLPKEKEIEADCLAAEILMPAECVLEYLKDENIAGNSFLDKKFVEKSAKKFNVSLPAMNMRLKKLGYNVPYIK